MRSGTINLYLGSMRSSKTSKLFEVLDKAQFRRNIKSVLVRPDIDTRNFVSRYKGYFNENTRIIECGKLLKDIKIQLELFDVICIDEGQFIEDIGIVCNELALNGKEIYIAALNGDSELGSWDAISNLLPYTDYIERLSGICEECGKNKTTFTFFTGNKKSQVVIGDGEYKIYCRECYQKCLEKKNAT